MWLGLAMLTGNIWFNIAFILFYWLYYERIYVCRRTIFTQKIWPEVHLLGRGVPAFIPVLSQFTKPNLSFSWKKVLKKKKTAFSPCSLFCLFDISGEYLNEGTEYNYFFIYGTILTGLSYVVLKFLKKKTTVLEQEGANSISNFGRSILKL